MAKIDDYIAGREDGLALALRIVEKSGIDGLRKEIRYRHITGIHTSLDRKALNVATRKIKEMTCDTIMAMSIEVLHDEFGFAKKRCERFKERFEKKAECMVAGYVTWKDITDNLKDEMGIDIKIRRND